MDLISIIVPIYNTEKYLNRCIDSIINQTYKNLEIVLVDDGSTDKSGVICDEYAKKDERIKVIHKENGGQASARNMALDIVTGDYIGFVDSDDWIEKEMYSTMFCSLRDKNVDAVMCKCKGMKNPFFNYIKYNSVDSSRYIYESIFFDNIGGQLCFWLFRAELWKHIRLPKGRVMEDSVAIVDVLYNAKILALDCEFYNYYFDNPNNTSNRNDYLLKNSVDRAIVFIERIEKIGKFNINSDLKPLLISKAVSFSIGSFGLYKRFDYNEKEMKFLLEFLKKNRKEIFCNKNLSIPRKIAVGIILFSPSLYYRIKNIIK